MTAGDWRGELAARYPAQLPSGGWLECSAGWFELLDEMFRRVQAVLDAEPSIAATFCWTQIKTKYGTLRAYSNYVVDEIEAAIDHAESRSEVTVRCAESLETFRRHPVGSARHAERTDTDDRYERRTH